MYIVKEKKEIIFKLLTDYYQNLGFEYDKNKSIFFDNQRQVYWYPYNTSSQRIIYQVRLTLRFQAIQIIQDELFPGKSNFTVNRVAGKFLSQELDIKENYEFNDKFLIENRSFLYVINEENNTDPYEIAADHMEYMDTIGLQLFEKLNNLISIDSFINKTILSKPKQHFSEDEINSIKKKSLVQEIIAGLIAANLLDKNRAIQLMEAYSIIYKENVKLISDLEKTMNYFSSLNLIN